MSVKSRIVGIDGFTSRMILLALVSASADTPTGRGQDDASVGTNARDFHNREVDVPVEAVNEIARKGGEMNIGKVHFSGINQFARRAGGHVGPRFSHERSDGILHVLRKGRAAEKTDLCLRGILTEITRKRRE